MLNVIMLNVIMLNIIMLSVIIRNAIMLNATMLSVIGPNKLECLFLTSLSLLVLMCQWGQSLPKQSI
jgi:hypothetical protein